MVPGRGQELWLLVPQVPAVSLASSPTGGLPWQWMKTGHWWPRDIEQVATASSSYGPSLDVLEALEAGRPVGPQGVKAGLALEGRGGGNSFFFFFFNGSQGL